jgi:hypothetical protein
MAAKIPGAMKRLGVDAGHAVNIDQSLTFDAAVTALLEQPY